MNKPNKKKKLILGIILGCLLVLVLGGTYLYYQRVQYNRNNNPNQKDPITEADSNQANSGNLQADPSGNNIQQSNEKLPGSVSITTLAQDQDGVVVGTIVNGVSKGTCTVVFEKGGAPSVTENAPLGLQVSYYTCKGFNPVPISKFSNKGNWTAYVKITDGNAEVRSDTKNITIE